MINQEHKDTYSLVVINWFREDREYLIPQYSRISACLSSWRGGGGGGGGGGGPPPPPPPPPRSNQPHLFTRTQLLFETE